MSSIRQNQNKKIMEEVHELLQIEQFLTYLAVNENVEPSMQN